MTDFNSLKARIINGWVGNENDTQANPLATNIWLKFNSFVQYFTDNFDSLVRGLISVTGNGSYDSGTGVITINTGGREVISFVFNGSRELLVNYSDSTQDNLGVIDGLDGIGIQSTSIDASGNLIITYTDTTNQNVGKVVGDSVKAIDAVLNGNNTDITFYSDLAKTQVIDAIAVPNGVDGTDGSVSAASDLRLTQQISLPAGEAGKNILIGLDDNTTHLVFPDDSSIKLIGATVANQYTKQQTVQPQDLTYAANIVLDLNQSNNFNIVVTGNLTLDNPTNVTEGQNIVIFLESDATGGYTIDFGTAFEWISQQTLVANEKLMVAAYVRNGSLYCSSKKGV